MKFFRHVEIDRKLPGARFLCRIRKVCLFGIMRKVYVYDFTDRAHYEKSMRLVPDGTRVINFIGTGVK